jgi:hypothetical protein
MTTQGEANAATARTCAEALCRSPVNLSPVLQEQLAHEWDRLFNAPDPYRWHSVEELIDNA